MKIAITGVNGFIGSNLKMFFNQKGIEVTSISHTDFDHPSMVSNKLSTVDGIINLAGFPIYKRWTDKNKNLILKSRTRSTQDLINLAPPNLSFFINASGIDRYDDVATHDEASKEFNDAFLGGVVKAWEDEAEKGVGKFNRVIIARFGVVLSNDAVAWKRLSLSYKLRIGVLPTDPKFKFSFIHIDDLCQAMLFLARQNQANGIYNFVCPENITYGELDKQLKNKYNTWFSFGVPSYFIKILMGEGGIALLRSKDVLPLHLLTEGFIFKYRNFAEILHSL